MKSRIAALVLGIAPISSAMAYDRPSRDTSFGRDDVESTGSVNDVRRPPDLSWLPDELGHRGQRQPAERLHPAVRPDLGRKPPLIGRATEIPMPLKGLARALVAAFAGGLVFMSMERPTPS